MYRKIHKLNTTPKSKQHTIQQNKTSLVQSPLTTLGQETRKHLPSPHGARVDRQTLVMASLCWVVASKITVTASWLTANITRNITRKKQMQSELHCLQASVAAVI